MEANRSDNVETVVTADENITNETVIDGFTLQGGHSPESNSSLPDGSGGGLFALGYPVVRNCTVTENFAFSSGAGLAFYINTPSLSAGDTVVIDNCYFYQNAISGGVGGGLVLSVRIEETILRVTDCLFDDNHTPGRGGAAGAVFYAPRTSMEFENCTFSNNTAQEGGGLYLLYTPFGDGSDDSDLRVTGCNFDQNRAITNPVTFTSKGGGLLYINSANNCTAAVENSVFTNNEAFSLGGGLGITFSQGNNSTFDVIDSYFESNVSMENADDWGGGGISAESIGTATSILNIYNSEFDNNISNGTGAGIDLYTENSFTTNIENCNFHENVTGQKGKAVHTTGLSNVPSDNNLVNLNNSLFWGHAGTGQGVIHNFEIFKMRISGCTLGDNNNTSVYQSSEGLLEIQNSIFHNPNAPSFVNNSTTVSLGGNLITDESMEGILTVTDLMVEDPFFVGTDDYPYQLSMQSPAINAGILNDDAPEFDLAGNPRVQFGAIDIGAYESPFEMTTSTQEILQDHSALVLRPNIVADQTQVSLQNDWTGDLQLQILNAIGQVVHTQSIQKSTPSANWGIDVHHLTTGTYFLSINNQNTLIRQPFIKQ